MDTEIGFLRQLETDLEAAVDLEKSRPAPYVAQPHHKRSWMKGIGAVAAVLVVAFVVGTFATLNGGNLPRQASFSSVGEAVSGGSGSATTAPRAAAPGTADQGKTFTANANVNGADLTKIIRDGSISLTIEDGTFDQKFSQVTQIARANGGYVLSTETHGSGSGTLVLRIPAKHFDQAVLAVRKLGTVTSSQTTGKDVTAQYIDNQARLQILEARKAVLMTLMSKATTIDQIIRVQNQLDAVQLNIEQIQGQLRYLDNQVAESTLTVDLREKDVQTAVAKPNEIRNPSLGRALDRAVQGFLNVLATVIVGLGYLIPIAILAVLVLLVVTLTRRNRRRATAD
jgi:hypothetical protein